MFFMDTVQEVLRQSVLYFFGKYKSVDVLQVISFKNAVDLSDFFEELSFLVLWLSEFSNGGEGCPFASTVPPFHNKQNYQDNQPSRYTVLIKLDIDNSFIMSTSKSSKAGKRTHKIIFLGDSGVGKTCIIQKFATNRFEDFFNPTIGIDFVSKDIKFKGTVCRLQLWDTAGQQKFKSLVPTYLRDAVACVFVFDLSKPQSLRNMEDWITLFRQNKKERAISIICGNKNDLDKHFEKEMLEQLIDKYQMPYYCVSAKTGSNLDGLFFRITEMLDKQETDKQKKMRQTYEQEYEHPPQTIQSFTRSQTKQGTLSNKEEDDKQTLPLRDKEGSSNKKCAC